MTTGAFVREIETPNGTTSTHGLVDFPGLMSKDGSARIAVTIGYGFDFGKGKCSVTVSVACDQTEDMMDLAADMAMHKADQLADIGMNLVNARLSE